MRSARAITTHPALVGGHDRLDWFLAGSTWADVTWTFAPTSVLEEEHPIRICWDFSLTKGRRFVDPPYAHLRECARRVIALVRSRGRRSSLPQRGNTVKIYFTSLRTLIRWMVREGYHRFDQLDALALDAFKHEVASRTQRDGKRIAPTTLELFLRVFSYLYGYRNAIGDGLAFDPWPGHSAHAAAGVRRFQRASSAYTPDAIAVPLVQIAIDFLSDCAIEILTVRERYAAATRDARASTRWKKTLLRQVLTRLRQRPISTPLGVYRFATISELYELIDQLYAACFVVIAYLVGARVSEILHLQRGCIRALGEDQGSDIGLLTGSIFKLEAGYHGRPING